MFKPFVNVVKKTDRWNDIKGKLEEMQRQQVLVGIPQAKSSRKDEGPNNAELAYVHSNGSPLQNIPARPFLQPSILENKDRIAAQQAKVIKDALAGNAALMTTDIQKLGLLGQSVAKGWFTDPRNHWPPLSPYTVAARLEKQYKSKKKRAAAMEEWFQSVQIEGGTSTVKPLIDSGQLRNAITYVVREK